MKNGGEHRATKFLLYCILKIVFQQFYVLFELYLSFYFFRPDSDKMQNDEGRVVDLYIPRKCTASNRLIGAKVQYFLSNKQ